MAGAYQGSRFSVHKRVFMILKCRETSSGNKKQSDVSKAVFKSDDGADKH